MPLELYGYVLIGNISLAYVRIDTPEIDGLNAMPRLQMK
jgi:hypothetical protein